MAIETTSLHNQDFRSYMPSPTPDLTDQRLPYAVGEDVYHWPEFIALCKRLNIDWERKGTTGVVLRVAVGEVVQVTHLYYGENRN